MLTVLNMAGSDILVRLQPVDIQKKINTQGVGGTMKTMEWSWMLVAELPCRGIG